MIDQSVHRTQRVNRRHQAGVEDDEVEPRPPAGSQPVLDREREVGRVERTGSAGPVGADVFVEADPVPAGAVIPQHKCGAGGRVSDQTRSEKPGERVGRAAVELTESLGDGEHPVGDLDHDRLARVRNGGRGHRRSGQVGAVEEHGEVDACRRTGHEHLVNVLPVRQLTLRVIHDVHEHVPICGGSRAGRDNRKHDAGNGRHAGEGRQGTRSHGRQLKHMRPPGRGRFRRSRCDTENVRVSVSRSADVGVFPTSRFTRSTRN